MNNGQLLMVVSLSSAVMATGSILLCLTLAWKLRSTRTRQQLLATDVDSRLTELRKKLETRAKTKNAQQEAFSLGFGGSTDPFDRAASFRQATFAGNVPEFSSAIRESFTERRHRILTLAQRGLDIKTIALRLGVPLGEVALIIRMGSPGLGD